MHKKFGWNKLLGRGLTTDLLLAEGMQSVLANNIRGGAIMGKCEDGASPINLQTVWDVCTITKCQVENKNNEC